MPRTVLITGCGPSGIGNALAIEFHLRGHRVFASGLSEDLLTSFKDLHIETLVLDVTSSSSIDAAVAHISSATGGKLDILINNAGVMHVMPFADTDVAAARQLFEVNVLGVFAVTKAFLPLLLASAKADESHGQQGRSSVVANIGSVNQVLRPTFFGIYNASKAAIEALGGTIRTELAPLGVRVVTVKTGSVYTPLFDNAPPTKLPEDSLYQPVKEWIEERKMLGSARFITSDEYAKKVVTELLRPSVKHVIWAGGLTTIAWVLSWFGWEGILDSTYIKTNHLDTLQK
ncbi:short-chain dehydrogenase/reductase [Xylaria sp. FL1777]|nr:short-chain dehydrogenase/reductase [Xylaria sp. FL1777]